MVVILKIFGFSGKARQSSSSFSSHGFCKLMRP